MDKMIGGAVKKIMGEGEKKAPVKSIKLKVKFQKESMAEKMKGRCAKCGKGHTTEEHGRE